MIKKIALLSFCVFGFSGCMESDSPQALPVNTAHVDRPDLTEEIFVKEDGSVVVIKGASTQKVKNKNAKIRTNQQFKSVKSSTLVIESGITEINEYIKNSTITVKKGAVLKASYVKESKIIVEDGGDLQISSRLKDSTIRLGNIENFSVRPADIDKNSIITEE